MFFNLFLYVNIIRGHANNVVAMIVVAVVAVQSVDGAAVTTRQRHLTTNVDTTQTHQSEIVTSPTTSTSHSSELQVTLSQTRRHRNRGNPCFFYFYARKQLPLSVRLSHRNSVCPSIRP